MKHYPQSSGNRDSEKKGSATPGRNFVREGQASPLPGASRDFPGGGGVEPNNLDIFMENISRVLNPPVSPERVDCLSSDQLSDFVMDLLDEAARQAAASHLLTCAYCRSERDMLVKLVRETPLQNHQTGLAGVVREIKRFPARLLPGNAGAFTRSNEIAGGEIKLPAVIKSPPNIPLSYATNTTEFEIELTLRIKTVIHRPDLFSLDGEINLRTEAEDDDEPPPVTVTLHQDDKILSDTKSDDLGYFTFREVKPEKAGNIALELKIEHPVNPCIIFVANL